MIMQKFYWQNINREPPVDMPCSLNVQLVTEKLGDSVHLFDPCYESTAVHIRRAGTGTRAYFQWSMERRNCMIQCPYK